MNFHIIGGMMSSCLTVKATKTVSFILSESFLPFNLLYILFIPISAFFVQFSTSTNITGSYFLKSVLLLSEYKMNELIINT